MKKELYFSHLQKKPVHPRKVGECILSRLPQGKEQ